MGQDRKRVCIPHLGEQGSVIGPAQLDTLRRLVDQDGISVAEAARTLKISRSTAYAAPASSQHRTAQN